MEWNYIKNGLSRHKMSFIVTVRHGSDISIAGKKNSRNGEESNR